ncbi:MAG TPA: toll/interleukin-1 receptor domain-containing protein [Candidatus Dormibacteraeota bacterium]|nr:toll/interleukin-1 receptor domain-containing protein [Candidatus Dormibacteraeota bacterium]
MSGDGEGKDFFISRTGADRAWAEWIGYVLEENHYSVHLQDWDFRRGTSFIRNMQQGATLCRRTLAVLSPDYFNGAFSAMEWEAALARDPRGEEEVLVTVRVRECTPPGLLLRYPYIDLVGLDEAAARRSLLDGVAPGRRKPAVPPAFPPGQRPAFPGPTAGVSSSDLPGRGRCIGRDDLVRRLVATVLSKLPSPVPVLGPPGVGKSTLTIAMLHDPRIARRFRARRWFIRCEGATAATALLTAIAAEVGVELGPDLRSRVLAALAATPALVVLDNAETPWESDPVATEEMLLALSSVRGVALVASFRGAQRPGGVPWDETVQVTPLPEEVAREVFLAVTQGQFAGDPALSSLVAELDGLPLAVELLAHAAQGEPDLAALSRRWERERATLLERGPGDHRLLSLATSLELSISGARMTEEGRRLLSLLGVLPDGIVHADLDTLMPGAGDRAATVLRQVGLASDSGGRLRTLAPIREYVHGRYAPASADLATAIARYTSLATSLGAKVGAVGGAEAVARLAVESANVEGMVRAGLVGATSRASVEAAIAMGEFTRLTGVGSTGLLEEARATVERLGDPDLGLQARVLRKFGDIARARSDHARARAAYERALPLYEQVGDLLGQANCIASLGDIALVRSDHAGARAAYDQALPLYEQVGDLLGQANCILRLGDIALRRSDHGGARAAYERALPLYEQVGAVLGQANCIQGLGDIALRRSDHGGARAAYERALTRYEQVGSLLGQANCIKGLGDIALERSDHAGARAAYERALPLYEQVGSVLGQANCIQGLGDIALERSDHAGAGTAYERALTLYQQLPEPYSIGLTHRRLARIAGSPIDRRRHIRGAEDAWSSIDREDLIHELATEFAEDS